MAQIPPKNGVFPVTHISAIVAAASEDRAARSRGLQAVVTAYRLPVYRYIRLRWGAERERAEDLAHGFFAEAIEKNWLARYEPGRARFRTFLRACLDAYLANEEKAARRIKRGGGIAFLPLSFDDAEQGLPEAAISPSEIETFFEREFARSLFTLALDELRRRLHEAGKEIRFRLFEEYVLADDGPVAPRPGYRELAAAYDLPVTAITNHLAAARREFRRILLEHLRNLTASEEEFRAEARTLLGVDAP